MPDEGCICSPCPNHSQPHIPQTIIDHMIQDRHQKSKCFSGIWSRNICSHQMAKYIDVVKLMDYSRETDSLMILRSQQGHSNIMLLYGCEYLNSTQQLDAIVLMHSSYPGLMIKHRVYISLPEPCLHWHSAIFGCLNRIGLWACEIFLMMKKSGWSLPWPLCSWSKNWSAGRSSIYKA